LKLWRLINPSLENKLFRAANANNCKKPQVYKNQAIFSVKKTFPLHLKEIKPNFNRKKPILFSHCRLPHSEDSGSKKTYHKEQTFSDNYISDFNFCSMMSFRKVFAT